MNLQFTSELGVTRADEIVDYLLGPRLWIPRQEYPDFEGWVAKVHSDLKREAKRALVALERGSMVGAVLYQDHKAYPGGLEIKNITVRPEVQGRYIASLLLRNAEIEGQQDFKSTVVLCDAKAANLGIRGFLTRHRYREMVQSDLYGLGTGPDIVFRKMLVPNVHWL